MLNATKGPAVWAPRAQADKVAYQFDMKRRLEKTPNLEIKQGTVEEILVDQVIDLCRPHKRRNFLPYQSVGDILGHIYARIVAYWETNYSGGRAGDQPFGGTFCEFGKIGMKLGRFKTGTPQGSINSSIDYLSTRNSPVNLGIAFLLMRKAIRLTSGILPHHLYDGEDQRNNFSEHSSFPDVFRKNPRDRSPLLPLDRGKIVRFCGQRTPSDLLRT